jgi:hypothetical protein
MIKTSSSVYQSSVDPDNVYYNVIISNPDTASQEIAANFNETRVKEFIGNSGNYELSVIRFSVPTTTIPLFIYDSVKAPMYLTLKFNNVIYQQQLPISNGTYIYSYSQILDAMNTVFKTQTSAMKAANPTQIIANPFINYDSSTQLFTLYMDPYYDPSIGPTFTPPGTAEMWMNWHLFELFLYFSSMADPNNISYNSTNFMDYQITANGLYGLNTVTPLIGGTTYIKNTQLVKSIYRWNTLSTVVLLSSSLPIVSETIPDIGNEGKIVFRPAVSDFQVPPSEADLSSIVYNPTAEYRMISLLGNAGIRQMQISIYYTLKTGQYEQLYLAPGDAATIKLLFRKT